MSDEGMLTCAARARGQEPQLNPAGRNEGFMRLVTWRNHVEKACR